MGTNTGLGIGIGIPFKNNALGGDRPYLPPELKARLIGVWDNYGKKNTDADRNIIKNKIPGRGGDFEILNAAYKLNSGFGEYSEDFTTWSKSSKITSVDFESFDFVTNVNRALLYYKSNIGKDIPSFKVRIKLKGEGKVFYNYITSEGVFTNKVITSEEYVVPGMDGYGRRDVNGKANAGLTLGIIGTALGAWALFGNRRSAGVLGTGAGLMGDGSTNINVVGAGMGSAGAPTAFQAWSKSCEDTLALQGGLYQWALTQQNQRFQDRQVIDSEMFGLYKSQIDADFLLYKGNRDNYDSLKAEISELKTQVAVSAAIRPYQDKLIQCEIERAFTAGINYVDKKTCNVIYGVTCLPNEPTTTGLVGRNANGCLPCGFTQTASTPAT